MTIDELIKILEGYEVFVDDDYGGSYQSIIAYTKDKKISKAFTSLGALQIIDTFEEIQKENQELKKQLEEGILESLYFDMITDENIIFKNQQKEFIEWLEQNIENEEYCYLAQNPGERCRKDVFEEALSKYKEIIGGKHE